MFPRRPRVLGRGPAIQPFGDLTSELPLLGRSLRATRHEEVAASGIDPERLTFADHAFATAPILASWAQKTGGRPARLAFAKDSPLASHFACGSISLVNERWALDVFIDAPPDASLEKLRSELEPVSVDWTSEVERRELPRIGTGRHGIDYPLDGAIGAHFEHWVHFLWVAPLLVPRAVALREGRLEKPRRAERPNRIHKTARIHRTAVVEGSYVGPGVRVGAFATIRDSYIGRDSFISDFTKCTRTVFGDGTHTLADASFVNVVALGQGTLANLLLKDTILGRSVFLTSGVIFWSEPIEGNVHVTRDGVEVDSGRRVLGGCAGHLSVLGARTIIGPGRALPNRTIVVMRKEEGVFKIPRFEKATPVCWDNGALVPFSQLRPGQRPEELESPT